MADGKLIFDTSLDDAGFKTGLTKLGTLAKGLGGIVATGMTAAAGAIGTAGIASAKFAMDFESAFAGVRKTVDASEEELLAIRKGILDMSNVMPQAASEIAGVAEAAGQLGIKTENILGFTETMVMLGDATNLSSEEAATSLARFANVVGMEQTNFDRLGSTIVALGNNFATTEAEIVAMGLRLAGTGAQIGLTEAEIMALSTAMSSVGISAEAGGSAMSRAMAKINTEVLSGGKNLSGFAAISGMSAAEFTAAWKTEPSAALTAFIEGLKKVQESGGDTTAVLKDLGLKSQNEIDTFNRLTGAVELLPRALQLANGAWEENSALMTEAAQRYATTESQLEMLKNSAVNLGIAIGTEMLPQIGDSAEAIKNRIVGLNEVFNGLGFEAFTRAVGGAMADGLTAIAEAIPEFVDHGVEILNALINGLKNNSGEITAAATHIMASLAEGFGKVTVNLADLGLKLITDLLSGINDNLTGVSEAGSGIIGEFIAVLQERIPELLTVGAELLTNLINGVITSLPLLAEQGSIIIAELAASFAEGIPQLMGTGLQIIIAIADSIIAAVPNLITAGLSIMQGIAQGIADNLPLIIENAPRVINEFANAIYGAIPQVLQAGLQIIVTLGQGIVQAIPTLIANIPQIIMAIINAFTLYNWAQAGSQIVTKLGEGIKSAGQSLASVGQSLVETLSKAIQGGVNGIVTAAKAIGTGIVNAIKSFVGAMTSGGGELIKSLSGGITGGLSGAVEAAKAIITAVINGIKSFVGGFLTAGGELIKSLGSGITGALSSATTAATGIIEGAKGVFTGAVSQFGTIGAQLIEGVAGGISGAAGAIVTAATNAVGGAVNAVKNFLGIKSPSRKMAEEVGKPISQGIAEGVDAGSYLIEKGLDKINETMLQKMRERHENLSFLEKKEVEQRHKQMQDLNILNIGTAYEMYRELHLQKTEEIEEEIARVEEEIANTKKNKKNEARIEELKLDKELLEDKKKNLEEYSDYFVETYEGIVEEYEKAVDKIADKSEKLADKLKSYGEVLEVVRDHEGNVIKDQYGNDMLKLTDLDGQIRQIANYGSLLEQLEARGADVDVMSKMLTLSVEDAVKYGELLMQQSDRDWDHYMNQMETKRTLANNIAKKYYESELETLNKEYTQKLTENLGEITEQAGEVGMDAAEALADGFKENSGSFLDSVKNVVEQMKSLLDNEINKAVVSAQSIFNQSVMDMQSQAAAGAGGVNITINGADYSNRQQSIDYANQLAAEYQREMRRQG